MTALLALGGATASRAQTFIPLANTSSSASFAGLFVSISGCSYTLSGAGQTSCATDDLKLEQVADGRGKVELEIVPTSGSAIFSGATGGLSNVSFALSVSTNQPSTATITSYALNTTGVNTNGTTNNFWGTASGNTQLTASILQNAAAASCTQTGSGPTISCIQALTPASSLNISVGLATSGATNSGFTLSSASFVFTTAPEPASLSLLAAGIGGLAMLRRRR